MQTQVTFRHLKGHHPELHSTAEEAAKNFGKYHDDIISTNIEFINDSAKIVNIVVQIQGTTLSSSESTEDFHRSLTLASDKIIKQLQKNKTKKINSRKADKIPMEDIESFEDPEDVEPFEEIEYL
jgi:ribosomal subunit interface protein